MLRKSDAAKLRVTSVRRISLTCAKVSPLKIAVSVYVCLCPSTEKFLSEWGQGVADGSPRYWRIRVTCFQVKVRFRLW